MKALALAALLAIVPAMTHAADPAPPALTYAFTLKVKIGPGIEAGEAGGGRKRIVPITGGTVVGRLKAQILPGGADWQILRPDGTTEVWAKYNLQPESGGPAIVVTNTGVRRASPDVAARIAAGEQVDPSQYYFRATPVFETGSKAHAWLTSSVFVCVGERRPDYVALTCYEVG
jgi:hypothetical protein